MRKLFTWILRIVVGIAVALALLVGLAYWRSEAAMARRIKLPDAALQVTGEAAQIDRGRHLSETRGCSGCHKADLAGGVLIDAGPIGRIVTTNLTRGIGGRGANYDARTLEHAIRHGVAHDGRPLVFMPSNEFALLSDADTAALAAYLLALPAVDRTLPPTSVGPLARVLWLFGHFPLLAVDKVPRDTGPVVAPPEAVTVEYGRYVAAGCVGCHGAGYGGGHVPGTPPDFIDAANLTPDGSGLKGWTEADFLRAMREGKRPDGSAIDEFMPWKGLGKMTDTELRAMWAYLQTLPPKPRGSR